jgi:signal transduction histidine kinase
MDPGEQPTRPTLLPLAAALITAGSIAMPASIAYALLRHRLLDINLVVSRSLVYGALMFIIGSVYFGSAAALGIVTGSRSQVTVAVLVTVGAILVFQPVRRRLDRWAAQLVYGRRLTGYDLLARFGEALEHAFDPGELAQNIASTVQEGLGLQWARVSLRFEAENGVRTEPIAAVGIALGDEAESEVVVDLEHIGDTIGIIECGPKVEGRFLKADHDLLASLGRQAALALHNGRLASELASRLDEIRYQAEELAASRARIVQAQDIERRRLERDIHDGVQQEIVSLVARLRLTRNQLRRDPELADATLAELQHEARLTLDSIRELARGIHPAVLTDKGLLPAIEARAGRVPVGVTIEAAPETRDLRYAEEVEATAYFFVTEALANALKHAAPTQIRVRLRQRESTLVVEVTDDGVGFRPAEVTGFGLTGMRDRVEAIRGRLRITTAPGSGTQVVAELPARPRSRFDA